MPSNSISASSGGSTPVINPTPRTTAAASIIQNRQPLIITKLYVAAATSAVIALSYGITIRRWAPGEPTHYPLRCSHAHLSVIVTDCARSAVTSAEKGVRRDATATTAATAAAEVTQRNSLSSLSLSGSL